VIATIDRVLLRANRRSRSRTLDRPALLAVIRAVQAGDPWASRDGGAVPNSYGYPAETTAVLAVRRSDGAIVVGATRMVTRKLAGGGGPDTDVSVARGPWKSLGPWKPGTPSPQSPGCIRFAERLEAWARHPSTDRLVLAENETAAALIVLAGDQAAVMEEAS